MRAPNEFRGRTFLLFGTFIGMTTGMTATMFYSFGAFIPSLETEFGWSRSELSAAVTILTLAVFIGGTAAGRLADRFGAARSASFSLFAYGLMLIPFGLFVEQLLWFWIGYLAIALVGVASTPIVMIKPIVDNFDRQRGLAMGLALTGAGITGFWAPQLVIAVVGVTDWRMAYLAIAGLAIISAPIVYFAFRPYEVKSTAETSDQKTGVKFGDAFKMREFWIISFMSLMMALGIAGLIVHLIPLFIDLGADLVKAAAIASLLGISSVVGRLVVGVLLDRYHARWVTLCILSLSAVGILLVYAFGMQFAIISVLLLGLAAGAEIDLISFLTSRYFGSRAYSAIYGWQYAIFALGYGFSPLMVGLIRDVSGNYSIAMVFSATAVVAAAFVAPILGAYRFSAHHK